MSHETHHQPDNRPTTPFKSSFWFVIILVGLFIAAVNFVNIMGHDDEGHGDAGHGAAESHETMKETSPGHPSEEAAGTDNNGHHDGNTGTDTTHKEGH